MGFSHEEMKIPVLSPIPVTSKYGNMIIYHTHTPKTHTNPCSANQQYLNEENQQLYKYNKVVIRYKECLKNHAAAMGGYVLDGCCEFLPSGEEGTLEAFKCAACNCHRNFHSKEIKQEEEEEGDSEFDYHPCPLINTNEPVVVQHQVVGLEVLGYPETTISSSSGSTQHKEVKMIRSCNMGSFPHLESDNQKEPGTDDGFKDLEGGARSTEHGNDYWKRRFVELETFLRIKQVELHNLELEKAFEVCVTNYDGFSAQLEGSKMECVKCQGKWDDLIFGKIHVQNELEEYERTLTELKERIARLEEDRRVICEREERAKERINCLEEENKMMDYERLKYVDLLTENSELERGKRRAEDEIEVWTKRVRELESQEALRLKHELDLKKELEIYTSKCNQLSMELEKKKMEGVAIIDKLKGLMLRKIAVEGELKECKTICNGQKEQIMQDQNILRGREKRAEERITCLSREFKKRESDDSEKIVQLTTEIKNLGSGKRNAEHEVDIWKKRFRELQAVVLRLKQVELKKSELKKVLEAYMTQCHGLCAELEEKKMECVAVEGKLKDLQSQKIAVDDELKEYKTTCNDMKELIIGLKEDKKFICEKEKKAQGRITYLEEEIRNMETYARDKYAELKTENMDLECEKRRADGQIEMWNTRFKESETRFLSLEVENSTFRCIDSNSHIFENIELETGGLQNKVSYNDKQETYRNKRLQSETDGAPGVASSSHLKIKEKMLNSSAFVSCNYPSSPQGNRHVRYAGPLSMSMQSEPLLNAMEGMGNSLLESKVDYGSRDRKEVVIESERSSTEKVALFKKRSVKTAFGGIIEISDSEDENRTSPEHTYNITGKQMVNVSTNSTLRNYSANETDSTSKKCLKRPCSDRRCEEHQSSYEEGITFSSSSNLRPAKTVTTESEIDNDDKIPIGKIEVKKPELSEGAQKLSHLNLCAANITRSSGGENVDESIVPSRLRLISHKSTSPKYLQMSEILYQNSGNPISENEKETVVEEIGPHSEGKSLGGNILHLSDSSGSENSSSDSEDAGNIDLGFKQVLAMVKRNRLKESKWQVEADRLSSFKEDSGFCMEAAAANQ